MRTTLPAPERATTPLTRRPRALAITAGAALAAALALPTHPATAAPPDEAPAIDLGREVIAAGDGWASWSGTTFPERVERIAAPTTGGAAAAPADVYAVDSWQELRDALAGRAGGSQSDARYNVVPRIVYVSGTLDPWLRADGTRTTCDDIASEVTVAGTGAAFDMDDYIAAFGPGIDPSGPLEAARVEAAALQAKLTLQHIGSNVTLVGVGDEARVVGASLRIRDASNVIVRNLTLSDAYDCFPQWDAGDAGGNWNSAYDNLSVWTSTSVWVDHSTFDDGAHPVASLATVYGRPFEVHDGLLDVTHGSDLVTMSWNWFQHHDKTDIIGSSDSRLQDRGQHRVTQHHNRWTDIGQRGPRVRFGDVHLYNNLYEQTDATTRASSAESPFFQYFWGAGKESSIVAESNAVELIDPASAPRIIAGWGGTELSASDTLVNGGQVDVLAAYNASAASPLSSAVRWDPSEAYPYEPDPAADVAAIVRAGAGAGVLRSGAPGATGAPGTFAISDDNGRDTGLRDGDYRILADLWWGQNATVVKLSENGVLVAAQWIDGSSPDAQHAAFDIAGRADGTYEYTVVALNPHGETVSRSHTVTVTDAAPGRAVLSASGARTGTVTIAADLWWGTNATEYVLFQDGVEIDRQPLAAATPAAQHAVTTVELEPGTYEFTAVLSNAAGATAARPVTVTVRG
jgi:pectate lyase